jgi:TonB family protein
MATQVSDTGSKSKARGSSDELAVIAQRAQAFTNASGTAIALSEGSSDEIVCRARSGASAPDVGTALRVEGSFTGLCIQSGKELRCDDAETDTRVDTAAIRALGIRSMVVTPIKEENRVVGVLAVFAPTAHAFTITHVAVLKTMADQIAVLLQKERKAREEGVQPEPAAARPSMPMTMPKPVSAMPAAAAPAPAPSLPPPVVIKPAAPVIRAAAFPVVSRVEPIKTAPISDDVAITVPLPRKEDRRSEAKADHRASLGTLESVAGEGKKPANRLIVIGLVAVILIGAGAFFAYRKFHKPAPPAAATAPQPPATTAPALVPGATTASTTGQPATPGVSSPGGTATAAPSNPVRPAPEPVAADTTRKTEDRSAGNKQLKPSASTPAAAAASTPAAVAIATGESKIDQPAAGGGQNPGDVAPNLSLGQGNTQGEISALVAKPPTSSTPSMISQSDLEPAQVLKKVAPVYPAIARARRLSGTVTVEFTVGKDGKISNLKLTSGLPIFRDAAFDAIKQWVFKPAKLNGQNIDQTEQVKMAFNPS